MRLFRIIGLAVIGALCLNPQPVFAEDPARPALQVKAMGGSVQVVMNGEVTEVTEGESRSFDPGVEVRIVSGPYASFVLEFEGMAGQLISGENAAVLVDADGQVLVESGEFNLEISEEDLETADPGFVKVQTPHGIVSLSDGKKGAVKTAIKVDQVNGGTTVTMQAGQALFHKVNDQKETVAVVVGPGETTSSNTALVGIVTTELKNASGLTIV